MMYYKKLMFFFGGGKRRWRQEKAREWSKLNFIFFKTAPIGHILKKSTNFLFGAWSFLLVHIWLTPSEGPKGFVNWFGKKSNHGSWIIKSDRGQMPSSMVILHGPWCKPALRVSIPNNHCEIIILHIWFSNMGAKAHAHCTNLQM